MADWGIAGLPAVDRDLPDAVMRSTGWQIVLPKRFARYGLSLHPEETRLIDFRPTRGGARVGRPTPASANVRVVGGTGSIGDLIVGTGRGNSSRGSCGRARCCHRFRFIRRSVTQRSRDLRSRMPEVGMFGSAAGASAGSRPGLPTHEKPDVSPRAWAPPPHGRGPLRDSAG